VTRGADLETVIHQAGQSIFNGAAAAVYRSHTLVKELEEDGIGRPSNDASIISDDCRALSYGERKIRGVHADRCLASGVCVAADQSFGGRVRRDIQPRGWNKS